MNTRPKISLACFLWLTILVADATVAQVPAPPPPPTLWSFLGIPQGLNSIRDNLTNRRGNRPNRERKPKLKQLADPANLKSENPAIKKAAEVKQAEDEKKQKIKAVKFLAGIGCGCYDKDGSVTDALVAAMDDCTEEVRLATITAICEAADCEKCANCKQKSCCNKDIRKKLNELAFQKNDDGCFLEPSERVRQAAEGALAVCGPEPPLPMYEPLPEDEEPVVKPRVGEGPKDNQGRQGERPEQGDRQGEAGSEADADADRAPEPKEDEQVRRLPPTRNVSRRTPVVAAMEPTPAGLPNIISADEARQQGAPVARGPVARGPVANMAPVIPLEALTRRPASKVKIAKIDRARDHVELSFKDGELVPGQVVAVYHRYALTGEEVVGKLQVVRSGEGNAIARPLEGLRAAKLNRGDRIGVAR